MIIDHHGRILIIYYQLLGKRMNTKEELEALVLGMMEALDTSFSKVIFDEDSKLVINILKREIQ